MSKKQFTLAQLAAIYTVYKDISPQRTVNCCTCGKSLHINQIEDCFNLYGHYMPRSIQPGLKYHPLNTNAQCPQCNMQSSKIIDDKYKNFMHYRYGENIDNLLLSENQKYDNNEETKEFYLTELVKLAQIYSELLDVVLDVESGEILSNNVDLVENPIEEQWNTYSLTYRQDLDYLTKTILRTEPIEYERL